MKVEIKRTEDIFIIKVIGELSILNAIELKKQISKSIKFQEKSKIIFDLDELTKIDSAGVGFFIFLEVATRPVGTTIKFVNIKGDIKRFFDFNKLKDILEIFDDIEETKNSFKKRSIF